MSLKSIIECSKDSKLLAKAILCLFLAKYRFVDPQLTLLRLDIAIPTQTTGYTIFRLKLGYYLFLI